MTPEVATQEHDPVMPIYTPIELGRGYDRRKLIQHYETFRDIGQWLQTIQKDPENTGVREDAGDLLRTNPQYYFKANRSPRSDLEGALSEEHDHLGEYAREHSSTLYGKLKSEDYVGLVQRVPLYKTGNREHDEFVEVMNENRKLAEASEDPEKMAEYVGGKVKNFPKWAQISYMRHGESDLRLIFQSYLNSANAKLRAIMLDEKRNPRSEFLKEVFEESLKEAETELDQESYSDKEKNDIWKRNIRPYYMALLEKGYEKEKKEEDGDIPQEKKDRDTRRKRRRAKGMPF
ncbi:MAG TPA: hypothetical protein VJ142_02150 [Candidatus Nanoarchaeia archaeon]|nr:hypothetical protein [Candidatus Nanoarchaeia archaeon]